MNTHQHRRYEEHPYIVDNADIWQLYVSFYYTDSARRFLKNNGAANSIESARKTS